MPRDLPVGNGNLLVNFDRNYNIRDIYYPHVGKANHSNGCTSRTGIWVDGQFSWLSSSDWSRRMTYGADTLATLVTATNDQLQLELVFIDTVDFHRDVFLRRVEITDLANRARNVRMFFHYDFLFWGVGSGDSIHYHPQDRFLIAYKDDCYFLMNASVDGSPGVSSWNTGYKDERGDGGSWADAEDGFLEERANTFGGVDGIIAVDVPQIAAGKSTLCYVWLAAARDLRGVRRIDQIVQRQTPQYFVARTTNYWKAWVNKEEVDFHDLSDEVVNLYKRSLLIVRTQVDNGGGIIAANDSDLSVLVHGRETYSYVWPRDGAYIANALDKAGFAYLATKFYDFCQDVIHYESDDTPRDGSHAEAYMLHKYTPDKLIASNWMPQALAEGMALPPIQEDETALIPYVLWQHYSKFRDIEALKPWFRPLIMHTGNFMAEFREGSTGLPAPTYDLWEEGASIYSYTVATVWAGLTAAAKFADLFGEFKQADKFRRAATEIRSACDRFLYDEAEGRFLKSIAVKSDGTITPDNTIDASLYGLWYFGMYEPQDSRIESTMKAIVDALSCQTEVGGLARYVGDSYHWDAELDDRRAEIPGNPWVITTLWLAQYRIAKATSIDELQEAQQVIDWVCLRALPSGVLAEQFHPLTGEPMSVSPLTWSHSTLVATVREYIEKYESLRS